MKSETKEISKIKILSLAKIFLICGVLIGLFYGIMTGIASNGSSLTFTEALTQAQADPQNSMGYFSAAIGWWAAILLPIIFGIAQFVYGLVIGLVYNLIARYVGGVKVNLI